MHHPEVPEGTRTGGPGSRVNTHGESRSPSSPTTSAHHNDSLATPRLQMRFGHNRSGLFGLSANRCGTVEHP